MEWIYLIIGLTLLVVAVVDALWTTLWIDGSGGPVTARVTTLIWRFCLKTTGRDKHHTLSLFGPVIVTTAVVLWVLMIWMGWVLVFSADDQALWNKNDSIYSDWTDRIYFVAYSMFTMGNGDIIPAADKWQVITGLCTASGMLLVTLSVTYLLNVVSAAVQKRAFATQVLGLGRTPAEFVQNCWNGHDFRDLDLVLNSLASQLSALGEQYRAYPVLQYYHAAHAQKSPPLAIAVLDEALLIFQHGIAPEQRPNIVLLRSAQSAIDSFMTTLPSAFIKTADSPPVPPDLDKLRSRGIPVGNRDTFLTKLNADAERRKKLLGLVRNDGWRWMEGAYE
ncbi:potassium channel family protein [Allohahella marinimesophila]